MGVNLVLMNNQRFVTWSAKMKSSYPWFICFFTAYISSFFLSGITAPLPDLDPSYQVVLEYARTHGFQFGRDIVFTFGPLGFLNTGVSEGLLPVQRTIFALIWSFIVAWSATGLARQIPGSIKFVFLAWFLIYSNIGWLEQHAYLVMIFGSMIMMSDAQKRKGATAFFLTIFAFLALIKFTFFVAATVCIVLCVLVNAGKRQYYLSCSIFSYYLAVFIALWLAAGQKIGNLFPWIRGSFEIANGYTEAMTIFPKVSVLVLCVLAGVLFLASLWVIIRSARLNSDRIGLLAVTAVCVFLSWKHGFVRADGHVMVLIFFLPIAFAVLFTETIQNGISAKLRLYMVYFFIGAILLCNWAADFQEPGTMLTKLVEWPRYMLRNSRLIVKSVSGNWGSCFEALRVAQRQKRDTDLPIARAVVGKAPVDVINYTQWAALANNLNYRPRPVIQGYSAYTPFLQDMNLTFFQSEHRPQYLLFKMETIDNRFPALDDATLLPYILDNYKPVAKDGEFLVLQTSSNVSSNIPMSLILEQRVDFGQPFNLPAKNNSLAIMKVDIEPTFFGKVVKFLFQSPVLKLHININGKTASYRFIPSMAEKGFLISPVLLTNKDVSSYYEQVVVDCPDSIYFSKPKNSWGQLSNTITVKLYERGRFP